MVKNTKRKINTRKRGKRTTRRRIMRGGTLEEDFGKIQIEVTRTLKILDDHHKKWNEFAEGKDDIAIPIKAQLYEIEEETKPIIQTLKNEQRKLMNLLNRTELENKKSVQATKRVIETTKKDAKKTTLSPKKLTSIIKNVTDPLLDEFNELKMGIEKVIKYIDDILHGQKSNTTGQESNTTGQESNKTIIDNIKTTIINKRMNSYNEMLHENNLEKLTVQDALYMNADYKYIKNNKSEYNTTNEVSVFIKNFNSINVILPSYTTYTQLMNRIERFKQKIEKNSALKYSQSMYSVRIFTSKNRKILQDAIPNILKLLDDLHSQILKQHVANVTVRIKSERQFNTIKTEFETLCNADPKCEAEYSA